MANGSIKKIVADRGFGFITGEDGSDLRRRVQPARSARKQHQGRRVTHSPSLRHMRRLSTSTRTLASRLGFSAL
jgi:cold shock CspA family protein